MPIACGTPTVASDIPGYREVLTSETSVAVPPEDPAALTDAVCDLVADEPRRAAMGEAARELAIELYSWPGIARRLERVYSQVTGLPVGTVMSRLARTRRRLIDAIRTDEA